MFLLLEKLGITATLRCQKKKKKKIILFFRQSLTKQGLIVLTWIFPGRLSMLVFPQISAVLQKPAVSWHPTVHLSVCLSVIEWSLHLECQHLWLNSRRVAVGQWKSRKKISWALGCCSWDPDKLFYSPCYELTLTFDLWNLIHSPSILN